jgi:hypothetical protein
LVVDKRVFDNLHSLHEEEERLRALHVGFVESRKDLSDHVGLIAESMNIVYSIARDHPHGSDNELTMQFLGIRLFNTMACSIKLAYSGFYQNAFSALRDLLETYYLVDFLSFHRDEISAWSQQVRRT